MRNDNKKRGKCTSDSRTLNLKRNLKKHKTQINKGLNAEEESCTKKLNKETQYTLQ